MREIFVMILSIIAVLAILYPIRPGWRKKFLREHYDLHAPVDKTQVYKMSFPAGCDKDCQKLISEGNATSAKIEADSQYDTVDESHITN